jgi:hypothetical protein
MLHWRSAASWASSTDFGPRWVRAATVLYGHERSPTVVEVQGNRRSLTRRLKQLR